MTVIGTHDARYARWVKRCKSGIFNGAYYYAAEIEDIILPALNIDSDVTIITAGLPLQKAVKIPKGSIAICHNNQNPDNQYKKMLGKDILWICSKESTVGKMEKLGERAIYIPLSIDTRYVKKFEAEKTKDIAYVGNRWRFKEKYLVALPSSIDRLCDIPREELLAKMATYKKVIAEGRCLMEAQVLGCEVEIPDYGDPSLGAIFRKPLDTIDAIPYWVEALSVFSTKSDTMET